MVADSCSGAVVGTSTMAVTLTDLSVSNVASMIAVGIAVGKLLTFQPTMGVWRVNTRSPDSDPSRITYHSTRGFPFLAAHVKRQYLVSIDGNSWSGHVKIILRSRCRYALAEELHSSYWPKIPRTDSTASGAFAVLVVSWSRTAAKILTAVAAAVTALGLY